jgi:hypothetical protein
MVEKPSINMLKPHIFNNRVSPKIAGLLLKGFIKSINDLLQLV